MLRKRFSNYNEVRYSAEKKWTLFTCGRTPQAATCHQINQQTNQNKYISNIIAIISLNTLPQFFFVSWRIKPFDKVIASAKNFVSLLVCLFYQIVWCFAQSNFFFSMYCGMWVEIICALLGTLILYLRWRICHFFSKFNTTLLK